MVGSVFEMPGLICIYIYIDICMYIDVFIYSFTHDMCI